MKKITSESNPDFKRFLKLTRTRGIKKQGLALLSGPKQVREVLDAFPERCVGVLFSDLYKDDAVEREHIKSYQLSQPLFRQIDLFGTESPILLIRVNALPPWDMTSMVPGCTLCIPFQDPANVGAVIRSATAFGVSEIVLLDEAAHPFHPRSVRAAGSSLLRIPMCKGPSISELKLLDVPLITLSAHGKDVKSYTFPATFCLVPGLEGPGLPPTLNHEISLSIPMQPGMESINAATATGIVLYLWRSAVKDKSGRVL